MSEIHNKAGHILSKIAWDSQRTPGRKTASGIDG